jgi:ribonuclease HI
MANKTQTRTLFESLLLLQPNTTLIGYTDGSKSTDSNITSCAVVIPDLDLEKAWTLETHSSVFSAELQAIKLALKIIYDLDPSPASTIIFSDSSSAIKAIIASNPSSNEVIPEIRELLHSLKSSGTQTTLAWILSHTGIEGNERADYLAGIQCTNRDPHINNSLSSEEKIFFFKKHWTAKFLLSLKKCEKKCITMKTSLKPILWHQQTDREISVCLHRLRSGHHNLNSFKHRIDQEADPSCRYGCEEIENPLHVLTVCPKSEPFRHKLHRMLQDNRLELSLDNVLGLNTAIDTRTQFKIRDMTADFLKKASLTKII